MVSRTLTNPLERLKILRQLGLREYRRLGFSKAMVHIWKTEGVAGFFKGNLANVARVLPFTALQFYFYDFFRNMLSPLKKGNSYFIKFACGGLTGILTSTLTYPLDLIRTFLSIQTSTYKTAVLSESKGIFSGLRAIVQQKGILAMFRGMAATNVGIVPYIGLQMSIFEQTQKLFEGCERPGCLRLLNLLNGAWSGFASAGLTYPLDVVRRKMQLRGIESSEPEYRSILDAIGRMYRINGIRSFFQGFWASQAKMASATALMFMANEELKRVFQV